MIADRPVITGIGVICAVADCPRDFVDTMRAGRSGVAHDRVGAPWRGDGWPPHAALLRDFTIEEQLARLADLPAAVLRRAEAVAGRSPLGVRVATATALQAWRDAELHEVPVPAERLGVVVAGSNLTGGYGWSLRAKFDRDPAFLPPRFALYHQDTDHVGVLSEVLGICGEGCTVGAAAASGNAAIVYGARLVETAAVDACLVLGALADLSPMELRSFRNVGAMAPPDRVPGMPFDTGEHGFVPGQGCAALILESARSSVRRRVGSRAELCGYALRLHGSRLAEPSEPAEVAVIRSAITRAGLSPDAIDYVNAHATGSPLGDAVELRALRRVFGASATDGPWVNATKALTGHCLSAAGVVEAVAVVLQLVEGFVHPTVGLHRPVMDGCRFVGEFSRDAALRYAVSNGFGFGGFNSSIVLARSPAQGDAQSRFRRS